MQATTQQMHKDIFAAAATSFGPDSPMNQKLREDLAKAGKAHEEIVKAQRRRNLIVGGFVFGVLALVTAANVYSAVKAVEVTE